ncbi:hypothetical protein [Actinocrispum sp. NPDC049592]|uniref:Rv3212 family protein n=1 Tax=Actinocrispum sp. NPDC049592 TaxID=3154835 RepID=UPI00341AE548
MPESDGHEPDAPPSPSEDVLDGPVPEEPRRGPRTSFHRPRDFIAVVVLVVVVVAGGVLIGTSSDIAATTSQTAPDGIVEVPAEPATLPPTFGETWRAESGATPVPVVAGGTVVTGNGNEVIGRDALTGEQRWRYARNIPLCTVSTGWQDAVAVYRRTETDLPDGARYKDGNCSEVTTLKSGSGERDRQRNGDAELGTRLLFDGTHMTATGKRLINTWRSDMVLTMEYGSVPDPVNPGKQPRPDCNYGSVAVASGRIGVIERCPSKTDPTVFDNDRLSVYKPTAKDSDSPQVDFSIPLGTTGSRILAVTEPRTDCGDTCPKYVAVAEPNPSRIEVFDATGKPVASYPVSVPDTDFKGDPPGEAVWSTKGTAALFWFTGSKTIALSLTDLHPMWTVDDTLGPGAVMAGYLLVPVKDAIAVIDQNTGARVATAPVNRQGYTGPVQSAVVGPILLEQRGSTLVALR